MLEAAALGSFCLLWSAGATRLLLAASFADLPLVLAGLAFGFALADLVTGVAHWLCDRVFDERARVFGPLIVKAFRLHHVDPLGITRHDFLAVNGNNALAVTPFLGLCWLGLAPSPGAATGVGLLAWASVIGLAFSAVATNQFHAWAHAERVPRPVTWLQRHRLLLSPGAHAVHHDHGFDRAYCVTTGWWNPLLDRIHIFRRLEVLIAARHGRRRATGRG